jgi:hypothetical protein
LIGFLLLRLIDFITCLPEILSKAATPHNIEVGFLAAGVIDNESHSVPDFEAIIATCRRTMSTTEYDNCFAQFPVLYQFMAEHGHIPDEIFEGCGLPVDLDMEGMERRRDAGISCEPYQRSKCLSHPHQRQLRRERIAQQALQVSERTAKVDQKRAALLHANKECEQLLLEALQVTAPTSHRFEDLKMKDFTTILKRRLIAFIHVRKYNDIDSIKWPKKGKLPEALTWCRELDKDCIRRES